MLFGIAGPPNPDCPAEDGKLKSATMMKENRHYYLDMKENQRGRFLRVSPFVARLCLKTQKQSYTDYNGGIVRRRKKNLTVPHIATTELKPAVYLQ